MTALDTCREDDRDRNGAARHWKQTGGNLSDNVPELTMEKAFLAFRLSRGLRDSGDDLERNVQRFMTSFSVGKRSMGFVDALLSKLLSGDLDFLDYLIISPTCEGIQALYRELTLAASGDPLQGVNNEWEHTPRVRLFEPKANIWPLVGLWPPPAREGILCCSAADGGIGSQLPDERTRGRRLFPRRNSRFRGQVARRSWLPPTPKTLIGRCACPMSRLTVSSGDARRCSRYTRSMNQLGKYRDQAQPRGCHDYRVFGSPHPLFVLRRLSCGGHFQAEVLA